MPSYLEVEYPKTNGEYVRLLCDYLCANYLGSGGKLLDIGSGVGAETEALSHYFDAYCLDRPYDLERDKFPYPDNFFDAIFSKSFLEHIHNTQHILQEAGRVLKANGLIVFMVPDWPSQWKGFYDDSTHIKPFTRRGLIQAFTLAGFKDIQCRIFYQLPFIWKYPYLKFIPCLVRNLVPDRLDSRDRILIRHSKRRMLLLSARVEKDNL